MVGDRDVRRSCVSDFFDMINMINMIAVPRTAWRKNLECGDKSRAVRGSRHRFPSALCAEIHLVPALSRIHLVATPSRLSQRRSVSTKTSYLRLAAPRLHTSCRCTHAQKAASRGIPLAAAIQILLPDLQSRCRPVKTSAPSRLCVKKLSTLNSLRAGTPALVRQARNTRSTRVPSSLTDNETSQQERL